MMWPFGSCLEGLRSHTSSLKPGLVKNLLDFEVSKNGYKLADQEEMLHSDGDEAYMDVRGDGGVLKRVLRQGNRAAGVAGEHPGLVAKCNYVAWIVGGWFDGRQVDSTRDQPAEDGDFGFLIGDANEAVRSGCIIKGLNAGVETMHRGELAELIIKPEYAYGAKGSPSQPRVPPDTTLRYEVELLTWKPAITDEPNYLEMPWHARLELAHRLKTSATEHYHEGQPEEARELYWKVGTLMDVLGRQGTHAEMPLDRVPEQNALATAAWLNEAMCYIRMAQVRARAQPPWTVPPPHATPLHSCSGRGGHRS